MKMISSSRGETWSGWRALAALLVAASSCTYAQMDTVVVQDDYAGAGGNLNRAVDSVKNAGNLSTTVFKLEPYGRYILTDTIVVPRGTHLTIVAPEPGATQSAAPPQILWPDTGYNYYVNFDCYGDITLKNVWLLYANGLGQQMQTSLQIEDSPDTVKGQVGEFDGVIFDYSGIPANAGGAVTVMAKHFKGRFTNCYFRNCTEPHFRYYGRAVSFPYNTVGWHTDSLNFENCTFANMGFAYSQEGSYTYGGGECVDYLRFNHCTFLNIMMYTLESGWWHRLSLTNCIFRNSFMMGMEVDSTGESWLDVGGTVKIDSISAFGFSVPFTESDRHILFTHSSYANENWLKDLYKTIPVLGTVYFEVHPVPMMTSRTRVFFDSVLADGKKAFPYMNCKYLYDSTDPGFVLPPTNQFAIERFIYIKYTCCADTPWAFNPQDDINQVWPMKEDLSYTNSVLLAAGMGRFPLGDLYHWFPDKYTQWKAQASSEYTRIDTWLSTGVDPGGTDAVQAPSGDVTPSTFSLSQNYPNPFNPTTNISFQLSAVSKIKLQLFDLLGRVVETLVDDKRSAGTYTVQWNADKLPSGVYFYRMTAGNFVSTRKLVLVK